MQPNGTKSFSWSSRRGFAASREVCLKLPISPNYVVKKVTAPVSVCDLEGKPGTHRHVSDIPSPEAASAVKLGSSRSAGREFIGPMLRLRFETERKREGDALSETERHVWTLRLIFASIHAPDVITAAVSVSAQSHGYW